MTPAGSLSRRSTLQPFAVLEQTLSLSLSLILSMWPLPLSRRTNDCPSARTTPLLVSTSSLPLKVTHGGGVLTS